MSPEVLRYFTLVETANEIREKISALRARAEKPKSSQRPALPVSQGRKSVADRERGTHDPRIYLQQIAAVDDIQEFVKRSASNDLAQRDALHTKLINECRLLAANATSSVTEAILFISPTDPNLFQPPKQVVDFDDEDANHTFDPYSFALRRWLHELDFENALFDVQVDGKYTRFIHLAGSGVLAMIGRENGYVLRTLAEGRIGLLELGLITPEHPEFGQWRDAVLNRDPTGLPEDRNLARLRSVPAPRVLRVQDARTRISIDFRSGLKEVSPIQHDQICAMHCASLPVPPEFRQRVTS